MIRYEYPFNESVRTLLRLEHLFDRLGQLIAREPPVDHHFALLTLFELMEVAARSDLKPDLLRELERQKAQFNGYRGNPQISEHALDELVARIDEAIEGVNQLPGKTAPVLAGHEWLLTVRSRIAVPAGTCAFDLPLYHAWQHRAASERRSDLAAWSAPLAPLAQALRLILGLLRDSGVPHRVVAEQGLFQQSLPPTRSFQLLRMRIDPTLGLVPEITGHRLMVSIRLMQQEPGGRLRPATDSASFELTLCA
ncbi:cell division protein ZapD [Caldimonas tepidiphila]|uniref:cell division protein ZapD n=1 Tax=Caldimonas tepidiphila TaxID=2315841 RepID=UPI000E5A6C52|nr:cell division protein ZapD [Caldimonas tepidiphila]